MPIKSRRAAVLIAMFAIVIGGVLVVQFGLAGAADPAEACLGGGSAVDATGTTLCVNIQYRGRPVTAEKLAELSGRDPFYSLQIGLEATVFDTKAEYDSAVSDFCRRDPRRDRLPHCQ